MIYLTRKTFQETYFYKTELIKLCRQYGLPTQGTKAELTHYINQFLTGTPANKVAAVRTHSSKPTLKANQISLDTPVVGAGFSFNQEARKFLKAYYSVKQFSFTKEMAIIKRRAQATHDLTLTVGELLAQAESLRAHPSSILAHNPEEQTYQWNRFVKDFCRSPQSQAFTKKLKAAALLWQHVKRSKGPK